MDPLYIFVFLGLITPGPNVILVTVSGARFGVLATVPHIAGIALGVGLIAGLAGFGIGALTAGAPFLRIALSSVAAAWMLYMALMLWRASPPGSVGDGRDRPWGIGRAVLFQWVNPKLWAVALAAASGYAADLPPISEAQRLALAFSGINTGVCLFWAFAGSLLSLLLSRANAWRTFTRTMALGLAASAIMVFL